METSKIINRTVRYIWEPGKTQPHDHTWLSSKIVNSSPDMFASIGGYCDSVYASEDENSGCVLTVLHGLYDCEKAAKDLKSSLELDGKRVCIYDCDNTDITSVFSKTYIRKSGLRSRLINRQMFDFSEFTKSYISPLLIFMLPFTLTVLDKIADAVIDVKIVSFIWLLSLLVVLLILISSFRSTSKRINASLCSKLINRLYDLNDEDTHKFVEMFNNHKSYLHKSDVNIFLRFDKLKSIDFLAYDAIRNYINNTHGHKQVEILFISQNQKDLYMSKLNLHYKYGVMYLNQLSFKEKDNLRKECGSPIHISKLDYFGVDAIIGYNKRTVIKYNQDDISAKIEKLQQYGTQLRCDSLLFLYMIAYLSCKYDVYMSVSEILSIFRLQDASKAIRIDNGNVKMTAYVNLVDYIMLQFESYLIMHRDGRYKFPDEFLISIADMCPVISRVRLGIWCVNVLLKSKFIIDKDKILLYCGETFNLIMMDEYSFKDSYNLFGDLIISILAKYESESYYYYYEDIFTQILTYAKSDMRIKKFVTENNLVQDAAFNNMIFSPGSTSWQQYREFVKLQADGMNSISIIRNVPSTFTFSDATYEECQTYYNNLLNTNNTKAIKFHVTLFGIFLNYNKLDLCGGSFGLFNDEDKRTLKDIVSLLPTNTNSDPINYIHQTIDELEDLPQQLLIISEYIYYPLTQLLACITISDDVSSDDECTNYMPDYNTNQVYDLIAKCGIIEVSSAEYKYVIDIMMNCNLPKSFKVKYFMTLSIMHNIYSNEIQGFIEANEMMVAEIIENKITTWGKGDRELYQFFEALILMSQKTTLINLVDASLKAISDKNANISTTLLELLDYLNNNKKDRTLDDLLGMIRKIWKYSINLALLIIITYVKNNDSIEIYKAPLVIYVILNATILSKYLLIVNYLHMANEHDTEIYMYLQMFVVYKKLCYSKELCSSSIDVVDKYHVAICKIIDSDELKNYFISREVYLSNEELRRNLILPDSYMLALSYNIYLITRFFQSHEYESSIQPAYPLITERFVEMQVIRQNKHDRLNSDYYYYILYILNNGDIQKSLISIFGRKKIVENIRENAIILIDIIIKRVSDNSIIEELQKAKNILNGLDK